MNPPNQEIRLSKRGRIFFTVCSLYVLFGFPILLMLCSRGIGVGIGLILCYIAALVLCQSLIRMWRIVEGSRR